MKNYKLLRIIGISLCVFCQTHLSAESEESEEIIESAIVQHEIIQSEDTPNCETEIPVDISITEYTMAAGIPTAK